MSIAPVAGAVAAASTVGNEGEHFMPFVLKALIVLNAVAVPVAIYQYRRYRLSYRHGRFIDHIMSDCSFTAHAIIMFATIADALILASCAVAFVECYIF